MSRRKLYTWSKKNLGIFKKWWSRNEKTIKTIFFLTTCVLVSLFVVKEFLSSSKNNQRFVEINRRPYTYQTNREEYNDNITTSDKIDWFISSLGVFSTIFLALIGYTVYNSFIQQRQIDEDMRDIRKSKNLAEEYVSLISDKASGVEVASISTKFNLRK